MPVTYIRTIPHSQNLRSIFSVRGDHKIKHFVRKRDLFVHENPCIKTRRKKQNEICFIRLLNDRTNLSPEQNVLFYGPLV